MDTTKQSVDIIRYLETNDFPVPRIINTTDEQPFLTITDGDSLNMFILYEYINGEENDCIDELFIDKQFDWLTNWRQLCDKKGVE